MKSFIQIRKYFKKSFLVIVLLVTSIVTISLTTSNDFEISKNLDIFTTLIRELNSNYVDEINPGELLKSGIDGMLKTLDPYTNFIPESELENYRFMTTGEYGGIGAIIHQQNEYIVVSEPYENSPAHKAGILAGDFIIEANNISLVNKTSSEVSKLLKGESGTEVILKVKRLNEVLTFTLIREKIKIDNIPYYGMLEGQVGYINLTGFTQNASRDVKDALLKLKEKNELKGLILDLRDNGGGLLQEAISLSNLFVEKNELIVYTKGKLEDRNKSYKTFEMPVDTKLPMVVLVNGNSASASEIVCGSIQDLDRGVIIGQNTFGKGLVQNIVPLSYNTKLKVTIAKYYIPSGRCIQAIDYTHKNKNGKADSIPDSLKTAFKTRNQRIVYDGKGIRPDIEMPLEKYAQITQSLISKYIVFDYANKYKREHPAIASAEEFSITENIWKDFVSFISDKNLEYETASENALNEFKKNSEKDKYFQKIQVEYESLLNKIKHNKNEDLLTYQNEIKQILKKEIIARYYYQKGKIVASLKDDVEVNKAIELLQDPITYNEILKGGYKLEKK